LEIAVRTNGTALFTTLAPRQPITSAPYSVQAVTASTAVSYTGPIADTQLSANVALLNGTNVFAGPAQFNNPSNVYSGTFTGNGLGLTNVPGHVSIDLFPNNSFYLNGTNYSFPSSTTAAIQEMQKALVTNGTNLVPQNSFTIHLQPKAEYQFSTPIFLTNNWTIEGEGYGQSGFVYVGATDLYTKSQVINDPLHSGLINFVTNVVYRDTGGGALAINAGYFRFANFYIRVSNNMPCVLLAGQSQYLTIENVGFFGQEVPGPASGYGTLFPVATVSRTNWLHPAASAVVGCYLKPYASWEMHGCLAIDLACGYYIDGQADYGVISGNAAYSMGYLGGNAVTITNDYYTAGLNYYMLGPGFLITGGGIFEETLINNQTTQCGIGYVFGSNPSIIAANDFPGNVIIRDAVDQDSKSGVMIGVENGYAVAADTISQPTTGVLTNNGSIYGVDTSTGGYAAGGAAALAHVLSFDDSLYDGPTRVYHYSGITASSGPAFDWYGLGTFHSNLVANSLADTSAFTGVITNPGTTKNYYVTNGIIKAYH
jgi:hypothetical protein